MDPHVAWTELLEATTAGCRESEHSNSRGCFGGTNHQRGGDFSDGSATSTGTPILNAMAKESFFYPETAELFNLLEETTGRSAVSRAQAFEDFLTMSVAALSGGRMEEQYLQTVAKHTAGRQGKRGCDTLAKMFGELVGPMEQDTRDRMRDIVGDLFEGGISYGEHGQFLTPMPICDLMPRLTIGEQTSAATEESPVDHGGIQHESGKSHAEVEGMHEIFEPKRILDPCCASSRSSGWIN